MWNSVLLDGVKWSFDRSSPPLMDDTNNPADQESQFRSWDYKSHHQTNYADWTNKQDSLDETEDGLFLTSGHNTVDNRTDNYPSAAELFRNFVGDEGADRMEFYINHLTMEGCDANNIAAALMSEAETAATQQESSSQNVIYRPPFPLLETITEETMEELLLDMSDSSSLLLDESSESPSSNSGRWGWGWGWLNTSDDDSSSVIHVPVEGESLAAVPSGPSVNQSELADIKSGIYRPDGLDVDFDLCNDDDQDDDDDDDGEWSERDQEVPKKKRRMDEDDAESGSSRSPSVTDSLIQFEALEKELGSEEPVESVVFRTSATSLPFEDADDGILSTEMDQEVFLDCQEHCHDDDEEENGLIVEISRLLETSSARFSDFLLEGFQLGRDGQHSTTCGSSSSPPRTWCSMPSLDYADQAEEEEEEDEDEATRSQSWGDFPIEASGSLTDQEENVVARPSWVITFDPPQETGEDEQLNDDDHWEPDGFLNSDIEEYDTGSNSDDDEDYSTERGDRFDEFGLAFISGRSQRMRSFRSYGDSLNLLDTTDDPVSNHSTSSSSSSCSPDRSSPEEDHRHPSSSRSRRSVEALSEDSGYGDASGSVPPIQQQHQVSPVDPSNNGGTNQEELRLAGPSTPPAKNRTLELPSLTICPPDGSALCSSQQRQWLPEVEVNRPITEAGEEGDWNKTENADGLPECREQIGVEPVEPVEESALLSRRQPRCRPTPLSLKEAEAFLILQDDAPEVADDCQSRCGVICICIDLEYKMSHTLKDGGGGNVVRAVDDATAATATNDDILQPTRTDLESKFNPQIGGNGVSGVSGSKDGRWEVPDLVGESGARERARTEAQGQGADHHPHEKQQDSLLLLYHSDGSDFIQEPDATQHNCSSRDWTDHNVTDSNSIAMDSAFYPAPVVLKRYGPRQEVEVYISQQQLPVTNESAPIPSPSSAASASSHIRGVHFSPVVSAVNWRESYLNQSEDESDADSDLSADPSTKNSGDGSASDPSLLPTKVRVESRPEVAPSVVQRVKLSGESTTPTTPSTPTDVVVVQSSESHGQSQQDSGRNSSNSTSCTTTATTNSKKPALFQRFSLSRLSARMSATFSRSESKRESGKKADCPLATEPKNVVSQVAVVAEEAAKNSSNNSNSNSSSNGKEKKNKNKSESDAKSSAKKIDDLKVVKEPKKRFFSRSPFQRSWSTPPMSNPVAAQGSAIQTRATGSVAASGKDKDANSSNDCCHHLVEQSDAHQESVARQPNSSPDVIPSFAGESESVAAIDDSRRSLVDADTPEPQQPEQSEQGSPIAPIPAARTKVQASHAKPPLPPQTKPRTIHARKNYLGNEQQQQQQSPPPVPMVSSAGLQHALQHFKETARMERERLANSVPDLAAPSTPTQRPTSDCIDPRESSSLSSTCVDSTAPALPPRPVVLAGSRERARQAVLSRASSVESAWNATASRAALNLSRRNIASSSSTKTQNGPTQGHGPTKSRPVVPGLLETNLDSVPSSYGRHRIDNDDETNLDELIQNLQLFCSNNNNNSGRRDVDYSTAQPLSVEAGSATTNADKRFKSMLNLGSSSAPVSVQPDIDMLTDPANSARVPDSNNRAKSMEFLLDEDNKSAVQVPENQLKKCGERKMSEHELRIQRSLQKLNVPEWYKNNARSALGHGPASATSNGSSTVTSTGVLRRRDYHGGSVSSRNGGWSGLSASNRDAGTASSMTSLGSALSRSGTPTRVVIPTRVRPDWRNIKSSRESLSSPADTCHSPSWNGPTSLSSTQQSFARWGSGRSSYSTCPSPAPSTSSSASAYRTSLLNQHGRAPYLGWRSQERLNNTPAPLSIYQSPAERLASTLLTKTNHVSTAAKSGTDGNSCERDSRTEDEATPSQPQDINEQQQQEVDEVVRSSIRQVTSAIVHYVSENSDGDQPPSPASRNGLSRSPERHPLEALSRSPSPRRQRCVWVESSFVGGPSNDSPNTNRHRPASPVRPESPPSSGSSHHSHHRTANNGRPGLSDRTVVGSLSVAERDDSPAVLDAKSTPPPPISATLDDVLNSLLGLAPPPIHGPLRRPVSQPTIHNKQVHHQQQQEFQQQPYQHQQQMRGNGNNNNPAGQVSVIQEARSFSDLRSSTYTGSSSQANN